MRNTQRAPKARSRRLKTVQQYSKRARNGMRGFTLLWQDREPFSESSTIGCASVDHVNPIQRIICKDMWSTCKDWIVNAEFTWQVTMRVIFTGTERGDKYDDYEFLFTCSIMGKKSEILNDAMEMALGEAIKANDCYPDGDRRKGIYDICEFMAVVVGV